MYLLLSRDNLKYDNTLHDTQCGAAIHDKNIFPTQNTLILVLGQLATPTATPITTPLSCSTKS